MAKRFTIGMLIGWEIEPELCLACAFAASGQQADFFYFYPKGVDAEHRTIQGMTWDGTEWISRIFDYPDVIYDRMRRKGSDQFGNIYEKLASIPMTHTLKGRSISKTKVYNLILRDLNLKHVLIPFMTMREPDKTIEFIHKHQYVVLKADGGAAAKNIFTAQVKGEIIEVFDQTYLHHMDHQQALTWIELLIERRYCAQKLIHSTTKQGFPFHIRVHVAKNGQAEWMVAFCSVSLSLTPDMKITNSKSTFRVTTTWNRFLEHQFGEPLNGKMDQNIQQTCLQLAYYLEQQLGSGFHEIGFDMGIDSDRRIRLFEAGIGIPSTLFNYVELARPAIDYSLYIAHQSLQ